MSLLPAMYGGTPPKPASDKSLAFMQALIRDRVMTDSIQSMVNEACEYDQHPSQRACSAIIDALKQQPYKPREPAPSGGRFGLDLSTIPAGYYAVTGTDGASTVFYVIDKPEHGKWAGWIFVRQHTGGRDFKAGAQRPGGHYMGDHAKAMHQILADAVGCMQRYGRETGVCGVCRRELTHPDSVALGIGPVCASRF